MDILFGILLAVVIAAAANIIGFDRSRAFYPVMLIVIATYYCLFATIDGSALALSLDTLVAVLFATFAIVGFRLNLWVVVVALGGHGMMDTVHHYFIANAGVPVWWPGFCAAFDATAAICLSLLIVSRGKTSSVETGGA